MKGWLLSIWRQPTWLFAVELALLVAVVLLLSHHPAAGPGPTVSSAVCRILLASSERRDLDVLGGALGPPRPEEESSDSSGRGVLVYRPSRKTIDWLDALTLKRIDQISLPTLQWVRSASPGLCLGFDGSNLVQITARPLKESPLPSLGTPLADAVLLPAGQGLLVSEPDRAALAFVGPGHGGGCSVLPGPLALGLAGQEVWVANRAHQVQILPLADIRPGTNQGTVLDDMGDVTGFVMVLDLMAVIARDRVSLVDLRTHTLRHQFKLSSPPSVWLPSGARLVLGCTDPPMLEILEVSAPWSGLQIPLSTQADALLP